MPERPIKPLNEALEWLTRELGLEDHQPAVAVQEHWSRVAGPEVAEHAIAREFAGGVLTVAVDDPAWATHLRSLAARLRDDLNAALGEALVQQIRVVVARDRR